MKTNTLKAFTLAEVLITLLIIGIVASIVIPNLINDTNNAENVVGLKKSYSDFQQAFKLLKIENGSSIVPVFSNDINDNGEAMKTFLTKLNYVKFCGKSLGCWYDTPRYYLGGSIEHDKLDTAWNGMYEKAILANGSFVLIRVLSPNCTGNKGDGPLNNNVCGTFDVDINGAKGPNKVGRDHFTFWIAQTGLYPYGSYNDGYTCNTTANTLANNWGCTAKVIAESGMNY